MIELLGDATGNCIRVAIALEEAGLPYRIRKIDLNKGEQRSREYLRLCPSGRVPTIIDDQGPRGERLVLTQSNAILAYLGEKNGRLLPKDEYLRAKTLEWLLLFVTDVIAPSHQLFHLQRALGPALSVDVTRELNRRSVSMYRHVDEELRRSPFIAGDSLSIADIAGYTITAAIRDHLPWNSLTHVRTWFQALAQRAAFQRGAEVFSNP
ncbi:MAG TPA: glutathione S-transferase family protein [Steroidobacteraceae bacterium]|nr:glutathione S-transferase family protein [Steroidobacteraceae bacterium]